jgi:hypothetical protein
LTRQYQGEWSRNASGNSKIISMESQPPAPQPTPKLLEQVRNVMRLHHYSIHTERSYTDWI